MASGTPRPHRLANHRGRSIRCCRQWAALLDEPANPPARRARLMSSRSTVQALRCLRSSRRRPDWASSRSIGRPGWHESSRPEKGWFERRSAVPSNWADVILQGPHLTVGTPLYQQPRPSMKSMRDNEPLDLERLPEDFIPRTSYQRARPSRRVPGGVSTVGGPPQQRRLPPRLAGDGGPGDGPQPAASAPSARPSTHARPAHA